MWPSAWWSSKLENHDICSIGNCSFWCPSCYVDNIIYLFSNNFNNKSLKIESFIRELYLRYPDSDKLKHRIIAGLLSFYK